MNIGLYTAYLGMRSRSRTLEVIANNIANASTTGFKAERLYYRSVEAAELERQRATLAAYEQARAAAVTEQPFEFGNFTRDEQAANRHLENDLRRALGVETGSFADQSQGPVRDTGKPLDVALLGDGYLVVQTPRGTRYTRAGSLTIDADGQLVTQRGELVVGEGGPITLRRGEPVIGEDGSVMVGGQNVGRLKIVSFKDPRTALTKEGDNLFAASGTEKPREAVSTRVVSGALETSNVNSIAEMAAMIQNSREFDSLQRSITLLMNDLRRASGEIGRL
ncbi:MAG TPA: flagellar basal-body rod protein FlgF [Blastocatellia bacterium]|nr:flagellar basal-body rod protein FlgF [Blastocatellia bacterium]